MKADAQTLVWIWIISFMKLDAIRLITFYNILLPKATVSPSQDSFLFDEKSLSIH